MELQSLVTFCQFLKVFSIFSAFLLFNHTSSFLLFRVCGYSCLSMMIVYILCFSSLWIFWCRFQRSLRARGTRERQRLLQELRSIDTEKIPFIIDRFLELERERSQKPKAVDHYSTDKQCIVCLDAEACIQTFPCEHVVVCGRCAWQSLKLAYLQPSLHRCVVCRAEIHDFSGSLIKGLVNVNWKDVRRIIDEIKSD